MKKRLIFLLLISLLIACNKETSEKISAPQIQALVWQLDSSDFGESRISIHQNENVLANYHIDCDLSDTLEEIDDPEQPTVDIVMPSSHPHGLLVVVCNVGAHSRQISVFDPFTNTNEDVFTKTGSYIAGWDIVNGSLKISYDRECTEDENKVCDERFEQVSMEWPNQ